MVERTHLARHDHRQGLAVAGQHAGNLLQRQPQVTQGLNAVQPRHVVAAIEPVARVRPRRRLEQTDLVEVVQGAHRQAGAPGEFTNLELHGLLNVEVFHDPGRCPAS